MVFFANTMRGAAVSWIPRIGKHGRMALFTRQPGRIDILDARIQRAKIEGFACGSREAKLFLLSVGKADFGRAQTHEWLNTVVEEGRVGLQAQRALEQETEAWDMSCRIAFLVEIAAKG
jgi:hypothetical protein